MGIIKPFMGGGFPWDEVDMCDCGEWISSNVKQCNYCKYNIGHVRLWKKYTRLKHMKEYYNKMRDEQFVL